MKILASLLMLGALTFCGNPAFALPTGSYDFQLSPGDPTEDVTLAMDKLFAFEWWYEPDPVTGTDSIQGVPDNFTVTNAGSGFRQFGDIYAYYPSTAWHAAVLEFPADLISPTTNDIRFDLNVLTTSSFEYLDNGPIRTLDNRFFIKDIATFDSYDAYFASIENGTNGNGTNTDGPVPEPGSMAMMGTGLLGMLAWEIKRRKTLKK